MKRTLKDLQFSKALFEPAQKVVDEKLNNDQFQAYLDHVGIKQADYDSASFSFNGEQLLRSHRWLAEYFQETTTIKDWLAHYSATSLGFASIALMSAPSTSQVLRLIERFLPLYMPAMEAHIEQKHAVTLRFVYTADFGETSAFFMELTLGVLNTIGREIIGDGAEWEIHFSHSLPSSGGADALSHRDYEALFGCKITFNSSFNGLIGNPESISMSAERVNIATYEKAVDWLSHEMQDRQARQSFAGKVKALLEQHANHNRYLSLEEIADEMSLTARTFSRKLLKENLQFKTLRNDVRFTRAKQLLRDTQKPLKQIAQSAGFQHGDVFSKAFKAQFGETPSQWRTNHRRER
ncbi:MAG: helix-turn-helix domain-containing protein [Oleispira sp.]|nr:helix-turn-helix domain-containing protein [Oleispira sp.]